MVSISPCASVSPRPLSPLRPEPERAGWDGELPPDTRRMGPDGADRVLTVGGFLDELGSDALDLGLRLLVVDSLAAMLPPRENRAFFAHAAAVSALREALDLVCAHAADPRFSRVIAPDSPLGAYVKGLYLRASSVARALEVFGFRALEQPAGPAREPDRAAFARTLEQAAAFHFPDLRDAIRRDLATLRLELGQTAIVRGLRDAAEQLFATSSRLDGGGIVS